MAMAFTYNSPPRVQPQQQQQLLLHINNPISRHSFPVILSFPSSRTASSLLPPPLHARLRALKTGSDGEKLRNQDAYGGDLLRKPVVQPAAADAVDFPAKEFARLSEDDDEEEEERRSEGKFSRRYKEREEEEGWVDWEDKILEDTVPLVGFVRMILHSGKYESGSRLSPEHEKSIIERLLQYHPEREKKIGSGIDYITIGYHPEFEGSRCLFIVRKDGELVDFSYWKCIKGLIRKNYPLYADSFILRHFRKRRRT